MRSQLSRREYLAGCGALGLGGLAGCVDGPGSNRGATDVVLHNEGDERRTVDVTVREADGDSASIDRRIELDPHSSRTINNRVIMESDYDVEVSFTDATMDSPYTETQAWTDAGQPLHVVLNDQIVFAVQIG